jgi:2',3'-cyclic-nucleotide 2'-phosphodiesterase (5'-nucleotidase family)
MYHARHVPGLRGGGPLPVSGLGPAVRPAGRAPTTAFMILSLGTLVASGCRSAGPSDAGAVTALPAPMVTYSVLADSMAQDRAMEALLAPYRATLQREIAVVIGTAEARIVEAEPEGPLGNLVADAMLAAAEPRSKGPVHMALANDGGLRVPLREGPVTVGDVYEVMPFENMLTVLELSGRDVARLAEQVARTRGEPIAGWSFEMSTDPVVVRDLRVRGRPLDPRRTYRIVVPDYLANGGGYWDVLWDPVDREDLEVLLRDAIIDHVTELGTVQPTTDGRIRAAAPGWES